jgi:hypothetical protein
VPKSVSIGVAVIAGIAICGFYMYSHAPHSSVPDNAEGNPLKPGDANYPVENSNPSYLIPLIAPKMELSNYRFIAEYRSDVKLCGHEIPPGGYFAYTLSFPINMVRQADTYRGSFAIDKFQPGKCGWKFGGVGYVAPDGVGNAVGVIRKTAPPTFRLSHIDMWCYRVTDGQFKSPDPKCELLSMLRWPDAVRRASPEFLAHFSHEQLDASGAADITTATNELILEFHDLNAIPGALIPVGDTTEQIKAHEEAKAAVEASPEGRARKCFENGNLAYALTRPVPDSATVHTQRDAVLAIKDKCRADFNLPPTTFDE